MKIPPPLPDDDLVDESLWDPSAQPKDPLVAWLEQKVSSRRYHAPGLRRARGRSRWLLAAAIATAAAVALWLWLGQRSAAAPAPTPAGPVATSETPREPPPVAAEPSPQETAGEPGRAADTR